MPLTLLVTLLILLIVLAAGFASYQGWRDWLPRRLDPAERLWRKMATFLALLLVSVALLTWVGYGIHNAIIGGDKGGNAATVTLIKMGNTLSFLGVIVGLAGKGRGRWAAVILGSLSLFLWFCQGMSL